MHHAPGVVVRLTDRRIARVDHGDAVHGEIVAIRPWIDGTERCFPDALVVLLEFRSWWRRRPARRTWRRGELREVAAAQPHGFRLRRKDAEDDGAVGFHFGGDNGRGLRPTLRKKTDGKENGDEDDL